jgi:hypothetical protein
MADSIPFYRPGQDVTGRASAAVEGRRFVMISGNRYGGPALSTDVTGNNIRIAHATAAGRIFGVAAQSAAQGGYTNVYRGAGYIVEVDAASDIDAFEEVEVGANGKATALDAGVAVGYAITGVANNGVAQIALY